MDKQALNELEIIGGGIVWFAVLLTGLTPLTIIGGGLYLGFLGSKMYG
jgi:hypothetical protein